MRQLGIIHLYFNEDGSFKSGSFTPASFHIATEHDRFYDAVATAPDPAQALFASWFERQNEVELTDRDKCDIKMFVVEGIKWPNGNQRETVLDVIFHEKSTSMVN